jgi:hypothetical protein
MEQVFITNVNFGWLKLGQKSSGWRMVSYGE